MADFGIVVAVEKSTSNVSEYISWWDAPELMDPKKYGFIGKSRKQLPSTSTDIYAVGMTILEVSVYPYARKHKVHIPAGSDWMYSIWHHLFQRGDHFQGREWGPTEKTPGIQ